MKRELLPITKAAYKANLHTHTTLSDGSQDIKTVKQQYKEHGYSVVAFSDHEGLLPHTDLKDPDFLPLTSYEVAVNDNSRRTDDYSFIKSCHMNLIAPEEDCSVSPIFNIDQIWPRIEHIKNYISEEQKQVAFHLDYTTEDFNNMIAAANEKGFLVTFNHPVWSTMNYVDYGGFRGLWGVECYNTGAAREGYVDTMQPIDDLLMQGEKVFPVAADDSHSLKDCFGGWVMIRADELNHKSIYIALKNGDFYASTGPDFEAITLENNIVTVKCSPAVKVFVSSERRFAHAVKAEEGSTITEAKFDLTNYLRFSPFENGYIRFTVVDAAGKEAHSRPYFLNELI